MEYLGHREIVSITLFDLRLSEGELMLYEACIEYVLKTCVEEKIQQITGCSTREELESYQNELREMIRKYVLSDFLSDKYRKQE